jgi:hypothetical protein
MAEDTRPTILVVNHNKTDACGVYQHGKRMVDILQGSEKYRFVGVRCDDEEAYAEVFKAHMPAVCIYNYYPGTMDWCHKVLGWTVLAWDRARTLHVGMAHEVTHADAHTPRPPFKRWIVTDPSFPASDIYFKTVRPLPKYEGRGYPPQNHVRIGTFGYAFPNKGFERVMGAAFEEFGADVTIRLHVTRPHFDGGTGERYIRALTEWADRCADPARWPGLPHVELTTDHWDDDTLLSWLASNHLNCLFYDPNPGRGISSAVDWCVAAGRPLAITQSEQFRHITDTIRPWPEWSLRESLTMTGPVSYDPVGLLKARWSHRRFIADYEGIIDTLLGGGDK